MYFGWIAKYTEVFHLAKMGKISQHRYPRLARISSNSKKINSPHIQSVFIEIANMKPNNVYSLSYVCATLIFLFEKRSPVSFLLIQQKK